MAESALYKRREFIGATVGGAATLALGAAFWQDIFASEDPRRAARGYGPLGPPDAHGIRLPEGFKARVVARGGRSVPGTGHRWHLASDGAATFPTDDGGWVLVSNSEVLDGGAGAIRFTRGGEIADAYPILRGTTQNCSGGATPWGTWLSCEEVESGRVWECDPAGRREATPLPAMGVFKHEAAAVDPTGRRVYLTEDLIDGRLYRFTPRHWPKLAEGLLETAVVGRTGSVTWKPIADPSARERPLRRQVAQATRFKRAEGIWFDDGTVYLATTGDSRIHAYDTTRERIRVLYDGLASREAPLIRVDQITASRAGELFVCEDLHAEEIDMGVISRSGAVARFLSIGGREHEQSELTGVTFDPSGSRMYFASQRAFEDGAVYEVSGPFKRRAA